MDETDKPLSPYSEAVARESEEKAAPAAPIAPLPAGNAATAEPQVESADGPALAVPTKAQGDAAPENAAGRATLQDSSDMANAVVTHLPPTSVVAKEPFDWQEPAALWSQLGELATHATTSRWADEAAHLVRKLGPEMTQRSAEAATTLQQLDEVATQAILLEGTIKDKATLQSFSRAEHSLARHVDVWKKLRPIEIPGPAEAQLPTIDPRAMATAISQIDAMLRGKPEQDAWEKFLALGALRDWMVRKSSPQDRVPRELAEKILQRLNQPCMSAQERQFVTSGPIGRLQDELFRHVATAVDSARLLRHLERYEQAGLAIDASLLAEDCQFLGLSPDDKSRQLGETLALHYRNANLRVAVSPELLNRLIPKRDPEYASVDETMLGLPVRGQSLTSTKVAVRLLPDPARVLLALEVTGQVSSLTASTSGPATFINDSSSMYTARKPLEFDLHGIRLGQTEIDVYNQTKLRNVHTSFDGIPLLSPLVKGVARSQHDQKQPELTREVKEKVAAKAQQRIDSETNVSLNRVARRLQDKVFAPLDVLALEPTMIGAQTTEQRAIMRIRLGGKDQLGSHTPRPQAPADSLASVQVHESVINNVVQRLDLDGRTFTLPELSRHIAGCLSRPAPADNPDHEDVSITFAAQNAVRMRCADGRVEVNVAIAKLAKEERNWKDFQIRAFYRPEVNGRSAELVRDGIIQLSGKHLNTGAQIALRGVFSRAFSKKTPWKLTPEKLLTEPKLADTAITQFVIDDGWIGVALGARHTALRPLLLRR